MKYILLFLCILSLSCKYNVANPVGTLKDYTAGSGKIYYVSSDAGPEQIVEALKKNKHSLGKYKIAVTNSVNSDNILSNITFVLTNNTYFDNVELDISKLTNEEIKEGAFSNAKNLRSVMLSDKVTNIGKNAFSGCSSLNNIRLGDGLTEISEGAFSNCVSLAFLSLDSSKLTTIGKNAFYECSSLESIILSASLTSIDNTAFSNCNKLSNVEYLGKENKPKNCKPFENGSTTTKKNLYLPNTNSTSDFSDFLGGSWNINPNGNKHIPS